MTVHLLGSDVSGVVRPQSPTHFTCTPLFHLHRILGESSTVQMWMVSQVSYIGNLVPKVTGSVVKSIAALVEDQDSVVPITHIRQLRATCNSSSVAFFWAPTHTFIDTHKHTHTVN